MPVLETTDGILSIPTIMVWYLFWYLENVIRKRDYSSRPEDNTRSSALRLRFQPVDATQAMIAEKVGEKFSISINWNLENTELSK